jgi:hypothetical protein
MTNDTNYMTSADATCKPVRMPVLPVAYSATYITVFRVTQSGGLKCISDQIHSRKYNCVSYYIERWIDITMHEILKISAQKRDKRNQNYVPSAVGTCMPIRAWVPLAGLTRLNRAGTPGRFFYKLQFRVIWIKSKSHVKPGKKSATHNVNNLTIVFTILQQIYLTTSIQRVVCSAKQKCTVVLRPCSCAKTT